MKIRKAVLKDANILADFNVRLAKESEHLLLDIKIVTEGVTSLLNDPAKGVYYVVEDGAEVLGQLMITYEWSDWRNGIYWWIQSVYVREEWRGRGIFTLMLEHIEELARKEGNVCGLRLYVEQENESARRTYLKLGFDQKNYQIFEFGIRKG